MSAGRTLSRSVSTRACAVSRPRANVTSNSIATSDTTTMLRTSKVRTKASGRSAPFGRTTSERASASKRVPTKAAIHGQALLGRPKATAPSGANRDQRITELDSETAEHDGSQSGRDKDQNLLRGAQECEVSGSRENGETDRRSGDVRPRRECDPVLTDGPVQAAPHETERKDDERHPDEEAPPEALVGRFARIRADREGPIDKRRRHDRRA